MINFMGTQNFDHSASPSPQFPGKKEESVFDCDHHITPNVMKIGGGIFSPDKFKKDTNMNSSDKKSQFSYNIKASPYLFRNQKKTMVKQLFEGRDSSDSKVNPNSRSSPS